MSSVLIISDNDEGNGLALELKREGHIVKVQSGNPKVFMNTINPSRIQNPSKLMDQFDLILTMYPTSMHSVRTLGSGPLQGKLTDAEYALNILNVLYPEQTQHDGGHFQCFLTLWSNGKELLPLDLLTLTYDRLCEGDRGPIIMAGSYHQIIKRGKLFNEVVPSLQQLLMKVKYKGPITLHLMLSMTSCYVNAILPQLVFLQGMSELIKQPIFKLLWSCVSEESFEYVGTECSLVTALNVHEPTVFPYVQPQEQALPHVWLQSTDGTSTHLGSVSARGGNVKECQRRIKRTIGYCVTDPEVMYRDDIGYNIEERMQWLKEAGWLE